MSEISLQSYENEIDQLIEQDRYVEALAHIRYLLSQLPHYVGAYYFLGKTMLEADLPELAVDMFRRALSADPEHLLSRIGLGLAHERRNNLDGALWNLERALELDSGNADIAEELRRMYERRDGIELDYVPQTRAGLARLYLRGRLYGRAADELGALLVEQPARPDLMTALAEAHWRNGQLVQAAEVSQEILDKMPYNCKANLLLGSLWAGGGQEEGWDYLRRAQAVDPRNDRATELFGTESLLPPAEATVDRLSFDPDAIDVDQGSAWFKRLKSASVSMGISEAPPEMTAAEMRLVDITASLEAQIEIPDWLRELGTGAQEEAGAGGLGWMADIEYAEEAAPEVEAAGMPEETALPTDVGAREAGFETVAEAAQDGVIEEAAAAPEWLQELTAEVTDLGTTADEGTPDWLLDLVGEQPSAPEAGLPLTLGQEITEVTGTEAAVADWLSEFPLEETPSGEARDVTLVGAPEGEVALPDWLSSLEPKAVADQEVGVAAPEPLSAEEIPDWLAELEPSEAEVETTEAAPAVEVAAEETPDWLAELGPLEAEVAPVAAAEEVPDWLVELEPSEAEVETTEVAPAVEAAAEETPDWLAELGPLEAEVAPVAAAEEVPDWLVELGPSEAEVETTEVAPAVEAAAEEMPDWLATLGPLGATTAAAGIATAADEVPDWLRELEVETPEAPVEQAGVTVVAAPGEEEEGVRSGAAALAWIEDLAGGWGEEPSVPVAEVSAPVVEEMIVAEEAPALVTELPAGAGPAAEEDLLSGDDALAWLESLAAGKEEELRIQVEQESERRVAEIMGRKVEEPAAVAEEAVAEATVIEAPQPEPELVIEEQIVSEALAPEAEEIPAGLLEVAELQAPGTGEDLLSGDDALAWLESLTIGKEEELRLQVEQESEERVAEILGRKRTAPPVAVEPEAPAESISVAFAQGEETVIAPLAEPEPSLEVWEGATAIGFEPAEVGQAEEAAVAAETLPEVELFSGEDALEWLKALTIEEEEDLRAKVAAEGAGVAAVEETATETVFGWSAFGAEPEEITVAAEEVPLVEAPEESEPVVATPEAAEVVEIPVSQAEASEPEEITVAAEEVLLVETPEEPEPVIAAPEVVEPSVPQEETPAEEVVVAAELPAPPTSPRAAAEPSATTETDLDGMRAYLKQKRSDHAARLAFARTLWEAGEIAESMDHYGRLVKSGAKADDVTRDLEHYAEQKPDAPGVLRTLGDAYVKFGALDKALEIYNRAMRQL